MDDEEGMKGIIQPQSGNVRWEIVYKACRDHQTYTSVRSMDAMDMDSSDKDVRR